MNSKAFARYLYSTVPGLAAARFAFKDLTAAYLNKPEYKGVSLISIGGGLIVDVGANRGQSVAAFRKLAPDAPIVAIEPEPLAVAKLKSLYGRDPAVTIHDCALGEASGVITFFVPHYGWWNCDGMAATSYEEATQWLSDRGRMLFFDPGKLSVAEHSVVCRTLDSFELAPRLIKFHAQGAELGIIKGAKQTILANKPALMSAFPPDPVTELLAGWGYRPYTYLDQRFVPGVAKRPITFTWFFTEEEARDLLGRNFL